MGNFIFCTVTTSVFVTCMSELRTIELCGTIEIHGSTESHGTTDLHGTTEFYGSTEFQGTTKLHVTAELQSTTEFSRKFPSENWKLRRSVNLPKVKETWHIKYSE